MKKKRLTLSKLKLTSFVTNVIAEGQKTVKGGALQNSQANRCRIERRPDETIPPYCPDKTGDDR